MSDEDDVEDDLDQEPDDEVEKEEDDNEIKGVNPCASGQLRRNYDSWLLP